MKKKCISKVLTAAILIMALGICVYKISLVETYGELLEDTETAEEVIADGQEILYERDLTETFQVILNTVTKEFITGYPIDETFLMWLDAAYGDNVILELAYHILDGEMDNEIWYKMTGSSIHALWLEFCRDTGYQRDWLENVYWKETKDASKTVISFTGDFNFAEDWCTMEYKESCGGLENCFSEELLDAMRDSDIMIMNNEFVYMEDGKSEPLSGKAYTFRANPKTVRLLELFGADGVTLANNHVYDYGETGLLDTLKHLKDAEIPYVGAGADIDEASAVLYYVANGRKIAVVSASQIERTTQYTKEATKTEAGVFKLLQPERFLSVIKEASAVSDYVIAVPHWGTEGSLYSDASQRALAQQFVEAGADVVIGGHPHRLQGISYIEGVPVAYSLGNFWFSDGTLYTTVAQVTIEEDGELGLRFLPCEQKNLVTSLLTESDDKSAFYQYLASISSAVGIDKEGNIYDLNSKSCPIDEICYNSKTSTTKVVGNRDNEGYAIDIVGNRK